MQHRRAHALLAILLELLADALALELGEVVDEELAVEMIDFVLDADGEQPVGLELERLARTSCARTLIRAARSTSSKTPGTDRQPSSRTATPSRLRISGIDEHARVIVCSDTSATSSRW